MNKFRIVTAAFFVLTPITIFAANAGDVVFNEIAWMGTQASYNDEWMEVYNNTNSSLNLEGWTLKATDGAPKIDLTGIIPANGFYLLERTNDDTVPNIAADQIYVGALGNGGEDLKLYDNSGNLIDEVNSSSGWLAGDNLIKQTMERKNSMAGSNDSNNWGTSQNSGGTPKSENSIVIKISSEPQPEIQAEPEPQAQSEPEPQLEVQTQAIPEQQSSNSQPTPQQSLILPNLVLNPPQSQNSTLPLVSPLSEINNSSSAANPGSSDRAPLSSLSNYIPQQQNSTPDEKIKSVESTASLNQTNQKSPQSNKIKQVFILGGVTVLAFLASIGLIFYRNSKF